MKITIMLLALFISQMSTVFATESNVDRAIAMFHDYCLEGDCGDLIGDTEAVQEESQSDRPKTEKVDSIPKALGNDVPLDEPKAEKVDSMPRPQVESKSIPKSEKDVGGVGLRVNPKPEHAIADTLQTNEFSGSDSDNDSTLSEQEESSSSAFNWTSQLLLPVLNYPKTALFLTIVAVAGGYGTKRHWRYQDEKARVKGLLEELYNEDMQYLEELKDKISSMSNEDLANLLQELGGDTFGSRFQKRYQRKPLWNVEFVSDSELFPYQWFFLWSRFMDEHFSRPISVIKIMSELNERYLEEDIENIDEILFDEIPIKDIFHGFEFQGFIENLWNTGPNYLYKEIYDSWDVKSFSRNNWMVL